MKTVTGRYDVLLSLPLHANRNLGRTNTCLIIYNILLYSTQEVGDLMYVVIKGDGHKVSSFLQGGSCIGRQICHTLEFQSRK